MKQKFKIIRVSAHTPEWWRARMMNGIGASEIGAVLDVNPWVSKFRIFYEKIGWAKPRDEDNEYAFHGRHLESYVANCWQYWDGIDYINNYEKERMIRRCRRVNGILINPDFPFLFSSLDRVINRGMPMVDENSKFTGELLEEEGILEVKQIGHFAAYQWESGIPRYYVIQVNQQMITMENDYAEMVLFENGRKLKVVRILRDPDIVNDILTRGSAFWDTVIKGRRYFQNMVKATHKDEQEHWEGKIHAIEPDPDGSDDFRQFMSEHFLKEWSTRPGTEDEYKNALKARALVMIKQVSEKLQREYEAPLVRAFFDERFEQMTFGPHGKARYYLKKGGKNYTLYNDVKIKLDEEIVKHTILTGFGLYD